MVHSNDTFGDTYTNRLWYVEWCLVRKEKEARKGTGFMNLLFLVVLIWLGYGAYEKGMFDNILNQIYGHSVYSLADATCEDLQESAIGTNLKNATGGVYEIIGVRNSKEISRNDNELICMGELLSEAVQYKGLMMTASDWDGEIYIQYEAY